MLSQKTIAAFAEHGDTWCLDVHGLSRFIADGERKATPRLPKVNGAVAVIPIHGVITKRGSWFSDGLDRVSRTIDAAVASKAIGGVVLDIDSPGGSSYGLMEFADKVHGLRGTKPIISVANPLSASAAYWSGTAADQMVVSPSGDVGSVGVWSLHVDASKLMEDIGLKATFIYAGRFKVEGHPYEPLSDEARAEIQRSVDETYDDFISALSRNMGLPKSTILKDFGEGRVLSAQRAKAAGMVHRVASLDEVLAGMGANASAARDASSVEAEKMLLAAWEGTAETIPDGKPVAQFANQRYRREREHSGAR